MKCMQSRPCQTSQKTNPVIAVFFDIDKEQTWQAAGLNHDHTSLRAKQIQPWWCSARYTAGDSLARTWDREKKNCYLRRPRSHTTARANKFVPPSSLNCFSPTSTCAMKALVLSRAPSAVTAESLLHSCSQIKPLICGVAWPSNDLNFHILWHSPALISSGWQRGK